MTYINCLLLALFVLTQCATARDEVVLPVMQSGLKNPESVCAGFNGAIFVSNIGERDTAGDGFITVLAPGESGTGKVFASGLNDPKGLAFYQKHLYVTDRDRVMRINESGKVELFTGPSAFPHPPLFLNDIAVDPESGTLYVSDSGDRQGNGGAIYRISPKKDVELLVSNRTFINLKSPNGVQLDGATHLLFGDMLTGTLYRLKLATREVETIADGLGRVDGIVWDQYGRLLISAIQQGQIWIIPKPGDKPLLMQAGFKTAADIGLHPNGTLLIPDMAAGLLYQLPISVPGTAVDTSPMPVTVEPAFTKLSWANWSPETDDGKINEFRPVMLTHSGGDDNRIFVATEQGVIYAFDNKPDVTESKIFADLRDRVVYNDKQNEEGFLGLAFHPRFTESGEVYVFYTTKHKPLTNLVSRFKVRRDQPLQLDPASEEILLTISKPFWNHDGGTICFGPDGCLYITHGDGGAGADPYGNGQNPATWLGKILRIDVNRRDKDKPYAIPTDNPFVNKQGALPEIYALGFRNVWRMSFDRGTGTLWAADVGQNLWEEINQVRAGGNYGWNIREGRHPFGARGTGPSPDLIEPIWEYHHDLGRSITGGLVYRGKSIPVLTGHYLYGDYISGKLWALAVDAKGNVTANRPLSDRNLPILSFGEDADGEVYLLTHSTSGRGIYRFVSRLEKP